MSWKIFLSKVYHSLAVDQTFSFGTILVQKTQHYMVWNQCLVRYEHPHLRKTLKATELWDNCWGWRIWAGRPGWCDKALGASTGRGWEWVVHLYKLGWGGGQGKSHWGLYLIGLGFLGEKYILVKNFAAPLTSHSSQAPKNPQKTKNKKNPNKKPNRLHIISSYI